ncbi:MAG: sigma-70 family RNA polymerase sigma factor [Desulfitobacterium sp.]
MSNEELCERIKAGEKDLIITLWEQVRKLIAKIMIRDYLPRDGSTNKIETDDLIQAGFLGMMSAIEDFDPSSGFTFTTYLNYHLKTAASDAMGRRSYKQSKDPIHRALSAELQASTGDDDRTIMDSIKDESMTYIYDDLIDRMAVQQDCQLILEQRERLTPKEREVFDEVYIEGLMLKEIAERHEYSPGRARQLHEQALRKIRRSPVIMKRRRNDDIDGRTRFYAHKGLDAFKSSFSSVVEDTAMLREWYRKRLSEEQYE